MNFYTPLRYPGGKARLGPWLAELMRHNRISGGHYAEPYAGGAGAALFLLMKGYVDTIHINDADPVVYAFWHAATKNSTKLIRLIEETPVTIETWEAQREIVASPAKHSLLRVGFAAFFLNRTNRSGILAGGVIGGKSQDGEYLLDARFNKQELIERLSGIAAMARRINISCCDARDWLLESDLPAKSLLYLDPPYYVKGAQLYRNFYDPDDHAEIAEIVLRHKRPVIVTYDDAPQIRALYANSPAVNFSLRYSTHISRTTASEVLFYRNLELHAVPRLTRSHSLPPTSSDKGADVLPESVNKVLV